MVERQWNLQMFLWKENLDPEAQVETGIITTLIYGNKCSAPQSEEGMRQLAEVLRPHNPTLAKFILDSRFVDDINDSFATEDECFSIKNAANQAFSSLGMEVKGWAMTGESPSEDISEDGTVGVAGLSWTPLVDSLELKYSHLHFGKVSRGRLPTGVDVWDGNFGSFEQMDDFVPKKLS